ncbi:MAG: GNAT family N-acyltransferase [Bdellovibrio sp.]
MLFLDELKKSIQKKSVSLHSLRNPAHFDDLVAAVDGLQLSEELALASSRPENLGLNRSFFPFSFSGFEVHLLTAKDFELHPGKPLEEQSVFFKQLGRERERSFRPSEGTGKALDLDRHDQDFFQLIVWDPKTQKIAAGYRFCFLDLLFFNEAHTSNLVEESLRDKLQLLYTDVFFHWKPQAFKRPGAFIEASRSFVVPEYQKSRALFAAWRGIGRILIGNPRYHIFIGATSITRDFPALAQELIAIFLLNRCRWSELKGLIDPPRALQFTELQERGLLDWVGQLQSIQDLAQALQVIHPQLQVPPLVKSYTEKIQSEFFGAVVDPDFNTLDFPTWMDASLVPENVLQIYLPDASERENYLQENKRIWSKT